MVPIARKESNHAGKGLHNLRIKGKNQEGRSEHLAVEQRGAESAIREWGKTGTGQSARECVLLQ